MDAEDFGLVGEYLLAYNFPIVARMVLAAGRDKEGVTPDYAANLADAMRQSLQASRRRRQPAPRGVTPATILKYYDEAFAGGVGGLAPWLVQAAAAFAGAHYQLAAETEWHQQMVGRQGVVPLELWVNSLLGAVVSGESRGAQASLDSLRGLDPYDVRLPGLQQLVEDGPTDPVLELLDDESLKTLHKLYADVANGDAMARTAAVWLSRYPDDPEMAEAFGSALENALLGGPGAPALHGLHPTTAGRMLRDYAMAADENDPEGNWARRRLITEMKGGKSAEYALLNLSHFEVDPTTVPDGWFFNVAEAFLFRSQRLDPACRLLEFLIGREATCDPRAWLLNAFIHFLEGDRVRGWADLLTARRFLPSASGLLAQRVWKLYFRDVGTAFGDGPQPGNPLSDTVLEAIDVMLQNKLETVRDNLRNAMEDLRPQQRAVELELRLLLTGFPIRKTDRKVLDSYGQTCNLVCQMRRHWDGYRDFHSKERLSRAFVARALQIAEGAPSSDPALYFLQAHKLASLRQAFAGSLRLNTRAADAYAELLCGNLGDQAAVVPMSLFTSLEEIPIDYEADGFYDDAWNPDFDEYQTGLRLAAHLRARRERERLQAAAREEMRRAIEGDEDDEDVSLPDPDTVGPLDSSGALEIPSDDRDPDAPLAQVDDTIDTPPPEPPEEVEDDSEDGTGWLPERPVALQKLRFLLRPTDCYIEYGLYPDGLWAVVVRQPADEVVRIPLDEPITPITRYAWSCCAAPPEYPQNWDVDSDCWPLRLLFATLLGPLMDHISQANRLIISGFGPLHRIPFAALHDGHEFVGERWEVIQVPNGAIWSELSVAPTGYTLESFVITDADGGWGGAVQGPMRLLQQCPASQHIDQMSVPVDRAVPIAGSAVIVHLSARGFVDPDFPLFSPVFLGQGPAEGKAMLMPWHLVQDRSAPALMVVDGFASEPAREGADSEMTHPCMPFHAFGAANVIATSWQGDPHATGELFAAFYDELADKPIPRALQAAQAKIRSNPETSHPFYWAGPVFSGEGNVSLSNLRKAGVLGEVQDFS